MADPKKGLPTLIRLHKWNVDEKRRALGVLIEREAQLVAMMRKHEEALHREQALAAADPTEAGRAYGPYADRWLNEREKLEMMLAELRRAIEVARDELAAAYRELKTYEAALEARIAEEKAEEARKEQIRLDEIAQQQHERRES